jgi:hypothetical protein
MSIRSNAGAPASADAALDVSLVDSAAQPNSNDTTTAATFRLFL